MSDDLTRNQTFDTPEGYSILPWHRGRVEEYHTNGMMNAHGGMMMTFADMAWGAAVEKDEDTWWVTVRLMCDFLSGASMGSFVEGKAEVVGRQGDIFTVEGRIWTGDKLLMRGTGIFKVIERRDGQQKPFKRASQDA